MTAKHSRMRWGTIFALVAVAILVLAGCSGAKSAAPTKLTVWTYYNGSQLTAFNTLVDEFNSTVGAAQGIVVESQNMGSVEDLQDAVMNSATGKVGAAPLPHIVSAYADTAFALDKKGLVVDLKPYFTDDELDRYIDAYLQEGSLGTEGAIKILPVAKSVEVLLLNETDFAPFAAATGVTTESLRTFEGIVDVAEKYYKWTDDQTEEPNDGKAFFGIDAMANYFFIGAKQMGVSLVDVDQDGATHVDFDEAMARRLWDNYYVPFLKGHFAASGRYRSDDIKTGNIIALLGSSSGATYFPSAVVTNDGFERPIEMGVYEAPQFANGEKWAVQQGAGMTVLNSSDKEVAASVEFLKWFTEPEQNCAFSLSSGYLPVLKETSTLEHMRVHQADIDARMEEILEQGFVTISNNQLYAPPAFTGGSAFRNVLEHSLSGIAVTDASAVRSAMSAQTTREQALAPYLTEGYFEEWYNSTNGRLLAAAK